MIEMELVGVRVELPANQPIVLLKEREGTRYLPIWIGAVEATVIAFALQGVDTARPLTHDLFVNVLGELDVELTAVHVTDLQDGTFFAELHLQRAEQEWTITSRPSDAIALASRMADVPLFASQDVLDSAGLEIEPAEEGDLEESGNAEEEVRQFREFLDEVSPEDFKG